MRIPEPTTSLTEIESEARTASSSALLTSATKWRYGRSPKLDGG